MKRYRLRRDVTPQECSWLSETVKKGTEAYEKEDLYGCCTPAGVLLDIDGVGLEIPITALGPALELV